MIQITYPSTKPKVVYNTTFDTSLAKNAALKKVTVAEYSRRDKIIKDLVQALGPLNYGDTAYPKNKQEYEKYGGLMILGVVHSYKEFNEEWPKNDNPMIVSFYPMNDRSQVINCTTNYLTKRNEHLAIC